LKQITKTKVRNEEEDRVSDVTVQNSMATIEEENT